MSIPDPIERMNTTIDDLAYEWEQLQRGVPDGWYLCPFCGNGFSYEPISCSAHPAAPVGCFECLPDELKNAYLEVFGQ